MSRAIPRCIPTRLSDIPRAKAWPNISAGLDRGVSSTPLSGRLRRVGIASSASSPTPSRTSGRAHPGILFGMGRRTTRLRLSADALQRKRPLEVRRNEACKRQQRGRHNLEAMRPSGILRGFGLSAPTDGSVTGSISQDEREVIPAKHMASKDELSPPVFWASHRRAEGGDASAPRDHYSFLR